MVAIVSSFLLVLSYLSESCLMRGRRDGINKVPGLVGGKTTSKRQVPCLNEEMSSLPRMGIWGCSTREGSHRPPVAGGEVAVLRQCRIWFGQ
jgi:hypothetical protein